VLQQAKPVDGGAVDRGKIGVICFVAWIGGLSILFGGEGMNDADLKSRSGEGSLNHPVIRPSAFNDDDQVLEDVASRSIANAQYSCVEAESVMRDCGRLDENATVEVSEHDLGASLGTIDAKDAEMLGANGLDPWVNDTTGLLQSVTTRLAALF
jgi:hypothetical protein